jgi:hypothetical protein
MTTSRESDTTRGIRRDERPFPRIAIAAAVTAASMLLFASLPLAAHGSIGTVDIVTRADNRVQPVYDNNGRRWIVGQPGHEYAIRVCNTTGARVLAVTSVDGVNVVSGETASPSQSGYVLEARECTDIHGWRKNLSQIAAFYFTELPDAYATRTGRPDNVGVIGVAFFRERPQPAVSREVPGKIAAGRDDSPATRQDSAAAGAAKPLAESRAAGDASGRAEAAAAPAPSLGTGHGRREASYVQTTRFERESATPNEMVVIHYDRRENLIAMGILPPPAVAHSSNPFPEWTPRFVADPPPR